VKQIQIEDVRLTKKFCVATALLGLLLRFCDHTKLDTPQSVGNNCLIKIFPILVCKV